MELEIVEIVADRNDLDRVKVDHFTGETSLRPKGRFIRIGEAVFYETVDPNDQGEYRRRVLRDLDQAADFADWLSSDDFARLATEFQVVEEIRFKRQFSRDRDIFGRADSSGVSKEELVTFRKEMEALNGEAWRTISLAGLLTMAAVLVISVVASAAVRLWI